MTSIKRIAAALALTGAVAASAVAAPVTYGVDGTHTFPRFSYSHFGYSTQLSSFSKTTGKVVFDAEAKKGSVDIVIDTKGHAFTDKPCGIEHLFLEREIEVQVFHLAHAEGEAAGVFGEDDFDVVEMEAGDRERLSGHDRLLTITA